MKRVVLVMPPLLPMPPVRGGAVETLVDAWLRLNEERGELRLTVYAIEDSEAKKAAKAFRKTEFRMIRRKRFVCKTEHFIFRAVRKLTGRSILEEADYLSGVKRLLRKERPDAVIVENCAQYIAPLSKMLKETPLFLHLHNDFVNSDRTESLKIIRSKAHIWAVSEFIQRRVLTAPGMTQSRVSVMPNCVNTEKFTGLYADFRSKFRRDNGISEDDCVFLFTGRVIPEKGVLELVQAFVQIKDPKARLIIIGSKWFSDDKTDAYRKRLVLESKPASDRIVFTGFVPFEKMPQYYAVGDIAVLPSIFDEPSGLTMLESLSSGLPLITTDAGGIPENVNDECAVLVKRGEGLEERLADAMRRLMCDPLRRMSMSDAARKATEGRGEAAYYEKFLQRLSEFS